MRLVIDIPDKDYEFIKDLQSLIIGSRGNCKTIQYNVINAIKNGTPLANITDEQISDAFQIAIANYWEEKSKHLTPSPIPCNCPIQENPICEESQGDV